MTLARIHWDHSFRQVSLDITPLPKTLCIFVAHKSVTRPLRVPSSPSFFGHMSNLKDDCALQQLIHHTYVPLRVLFLHGISLGLHLWYKDICAFWKLVHTSSIQRELWRIQALWTFAQLQSDCAFLYRHVAVTQVERRHAQLLKGKSEPPAQSENRNQGTMNNYHEEKEEICNSSSPYQMVDAWPCIEWRNLDHPERNTMQRKLNKRNQLPNLPYAFPHPQMHPI